MIHLYDNTDSGNCYKIRLLLAHLGQDYDRSELDTESGETRTAHFLSMNPNGRVPLVRTPDGAYLAESGAILWFLAQGSRYLPRDPWSVAQVLQWIFFEQYSHEPNIAVLRHWNRGAQHRAIAEQVETKLRLGYAALDVMENHLTQSRFFVAETYSIADIALFAYTHVAHQGGFSLERYPHIRAWLDRVRGQEGYVCLPE